MAGSSGAPLALAPRKETLMTANDGFLGIVDKVLVDIEDVKGRFPGTFAKQKKIPQRALATLNFGHSPKKKRKNL